MKVLITGFEPIWGLIKSPSGELAKLWADGSVSIPNVDVKALVLPQVFGLSAEMLQAEIVSYKPNIVIMFGATMKNDPIRLEKFAVNIENSSMGDNSRIPVKDRYILPGGPAGYESTLPVGYLADRMSAAGVNAKVSYHAGTHTCNSIQYRTLHFLANNNIGHPIHACFTHVAFPNSFGVVEDDLWATSDFSGIVNASMILVQEAAFWYQQTYGIK